MSGAAPAWEGLTPEELRRRWGRPDLHVYLRVDSTNSCARRLAERGAPPGTLVLADEQAAGRGVASHRWFSPSGAGLYLSLVLRPRPAPNPLLIPLLAGLATARAVARLVPELPVGVKWPNDLICADRKAGGVLSEAVSAADELRYVVVGVGVNVHQSRDDFPELLREVATSLDTAAARRVSRLELADLVIAELERHCAELPEKLDRERLKEWDSYDWLRGRRCAVARPGSVTRVGIAVGIAEDGALLLQPEGAGPERVTAGRVLVEGLVTPDY